jgi:hypothetical protein
LAKLFAPTDEGYGLRILKTGDSSS